MVQLEKHGYFPPTLRISSATLEPGTSPQLHRYSKTLEDQHVRLNVWDTPSVPYEKYDQERFPAYPNSDVIIICFSVSSPSSLADVETQVILHYGVG